MGILRWSSVTHEYVTWFPFSFLTNCRLRKGWDASPTFSNKKRGGPMIFDVRVAQAVTPNSRHTLHLILIYMNERSEG